MTRLLIAASLICLVAAGCGGVQNEPNLAEAVERTEATGSVRFKFDGVHDEDEIRCTGTVEHARKRVHVDCEYADLGRLEAIGIGNEFYYRGPWAAGGGIGVDQWVKTTGDDEDDSLQNFSPEHIVSILRRASSETERVGEEDVRDTPTVRYRLTVDCGRALLECDGEAPVEVWIDEDGLVRRIEFDDDSGTGTFEFFDFGADVDIEPPPADEVVDEELLGSSGVTPGQPETRCAGQAAPVSVEQATAALVRHGFDVKRDELGCGPGVAASLSTWDSQSEPMLFCSVMTGLRTPNTVTAVSVPGGANQVEVERRLENLRCVLYARQRTDEAVGRLDDALAELK